MGRQGSFEAMLLRWSETSSGGATITLQLADPDELEAFKVMTLAKKGMVGQLLDINWREMDPDNPEPHGDGTLLMSGELGMTDPVIIHSSPAADLKPRTVGPLCLLAVRWCRMVEFQSWISSAYAKEWEVVRETGTPETVTARVVCDLCGIESRSELDTNPDAADAFHEKIRLPFRFIAEAMGASHGDR